MEIGLGKKTRRTYGFDEIALVPTGNTLDLELCQTKIELGGFELAAPIVASAMDSVTSPENLVKIAQEGAIGVLNLSGIYTRYKDYQSVLKKISDAPKESFVTLMQEIYKEPIKDDLIIDVVKKIKASFPTDKKYPVLVSVTPLQANKYQKTLEEAGVDIVVIQSTVVGLEHKAWTEREGFDENAILDLEKFCSKSSIPVIVGNCVDYNIALKLMRTGIAGLLVGIGPGAACTSRGVLGIGVPMATAIADCRAARDEFQKEANKYVPIIADGGMHTGGDICKAIACGADLVMIGSPFARCKEAPGNGYHWGMATPSPVLPRGTRIEVGSASTLHQLLHGPAETEDGTQNLIGALKTSMSTLGAANLTEMQDVEVIIAPSIRTEGKLHQTAQKLGMGR